MSDFQQIFKRFEKKYIVTSKQRTELLADIDEYIMPDAYGKSTVCNIYFDTPDFRLIRQSIEKPIYKEKLRIRSYGCPNAQSNVFLELKKKYKGVVYKRRINMPYADCINYMYRHIYPKNVDRQILSEIDYCLYFYKNIKPAVSLFYDRNAYYSKEDSELRITFDSNVRFRNNDFDLSKGSNGYQLLENDLSIMEIKCIDAMPLWLTSELDKLKIFPATFSKYGQAYKTITSLTDSIDYMPAEAAST